MSSLRRPWLGRDWTALLEGDEALTTAILDSLLYNADVIQTPGETYRLREARQSGLLGHRRAN